MARKLELCYVGGFLKKVFNVKFLKNLPNQLGADAVSQKNG
jgi:hypothetical protein